MSGAKVRLIGLLIRAGALYELDSQLKGIFIARKRLQDAVKTCQSKMKSSLFSKVINSFFAPQLPGWLASSYSPLWY